LDNDQEFLNFSFFNKDEKLNLNHLLMNLFYFHSNVNYQKSEMKALQNQSEIKKDITILKTD
jgi:hypothetical protein